MSFPLAEWERRGQSLLPRYVLFWLGGHLLLDAVTAVGFLRALDALLRLPELLFTGFLQGVLYGVVHLGCLFVLEHRGVLSRHTPVAASLWVGACLGVGVLAFATPRDALFAFRLFEGVPLVLPFLAGAWAAGFAWLPALR